MKVINNKDDLEKALFRINELWDNEKDSVNAYELDSLITLVSDYEDSIIFSERSSQSEIEFDINDL
ncbi:hypothetical protein KO505_14365 [Psychrosphaera sp. F3M07]|uniref:hypothetical protein n=1 Tax=Psychrosphaera sp. F3M07 TaxID=2841560 RepID=UPI001C08E817|nr:hypothetical protein [Psychrosphaera sp. F3M07]MBU2919127.1 hypothetical protein [Psychrosphaera sp. F3M07]